MLFPQKLIRNHSQGESQDLGYETVVVFLFNVSFVLQVGGQRRHAELSSGSLNFEGHSSMDKLQVESSDSLVLEPLELRLPCLPALGGEPSCKNFANAISVNPLHSKLNRVSCWALLKKC